MSNWMQNPVRTTTVERLEVSIRYRDMAIPCRARGREASGFEARRMSNERWKEICQVRKEESPGFVGCAGAEEVFSGTAFRMLSEYIFFY